MASDEEVEDELSGLQIELAALKQALGKNYQEARRHPISRAEAALRMPLARPLQAADWPGTLLLGSVPAGGGG